MNKKVHFSMLPACINPFTFVNNFNSYMKKEMSLLPAIFTFIGKSNRKEEMRDAKQRFAWLKMLSLILVAAISSLPTTASATNYYKATTNVTTSSASGWLVSTDSATYAAASTAPQGLVTDVITMTGSYALTVNSTITFYGVLHLRGTGQFTVTGNLTMASGSICEYNVLFGNSPSPCIPSTNVTWDANSTIVIDGVTSNASFFTLGATYGNLIYNVPTTGFYNFASTSLATFFTNSASAGTLTFAGNVSILSTGGANSKIKLFGGPVANSGTTNTLVVGGNFYCNPIANTQFQHENTAGNTCIFSIGGSVSGSLGSGQSGGTPVSVETLNLTGSGNIDLGTGGTFLNTMRATNVNISGNYTLASNMAGFTSTPFTTYTVTGALDCGAFVVSGTSNPFTLASGATLKTSLAAGINGAVNIISPVPTFSTSANYEFTGSAASAVTGAYMPATVNNLTIRNSAGLTLSSATTVNGILSLAAGNFTIGSNLTMGTSAIVNRLGGTLSAAPTFGATKSIGYGQKLVTNAATTTVASSINTSAATTATSLTTSAATATSVSLTASSVTTYVAGLATFAANTFVFSNIATATSSGGTTLTFGTTTGITNGMVVTGTNIAPGTTVSGTPTSTVVTLSQATSGAVAIGQSITFSTAAINTITFSTANATTINGYTTGSAVWGANIPLGTTVSSVNTSTGVVTLSQNLIGTVASGATIVFGNNIINFASTTGVNVGDIITGTGIQSGTTVLSLTSGTITLSAPITASTVTTANAIIAAGTGLAFSSGTTGVAIGQSVSGTGIPQSAFVVGVTATSVFLSETVSATVASGATITFGGTSLSMVSTTGVAIGQTVVGTNIASGTTVTSVSATTVGLSSPVASTGISSGAAINFNGNTLYFANTFGVAVGQVVSGTNIPASTTVTAVTPNSVTLNNAVTSSGVASGASIYFSTSSAITTTANELPSSVTNLSIANANGVTLNAAATVTGTLTLTSGNLSLGVNNLALNTSNAVAGTPGASNHIVTGSTGYVTGTANFSTAYTFPVGYDATNYNPLTVTPSSQNPTVIAKSITPTLSATVSSKAMWTVGGVTSSATILAFPWNSTTDITGTFQAGMILYSLSGGVWSAITASSTSGSSPAYSTSLTGVVIANPTTFGIGPNSTPTLSLTSTAGTNTQTVNTLTAITNITYSWGGAATGAAVTWTGTANSTTAPTGITVNTSGSVTISGTATAAGTYGYTVTTIGGSPAVNLTGTLTVNPVANVAIAAISAYGNANVFSGATDTIANFSLAVNTISATLTSVSLPITTSGFVSGDITNYKLYYTTGSTFTSPTLLSTFTSNLATSPISFTSFSQTISSGATGYFWVTTDIAAAATASHTLSVNALSASNLGFSVAVSGSGTVAAGGTQTIIYPTYYNVNNSDISSLSSWGTDSATGSGTHPANFTNPNVTYNVYKGTVNTLGSTTTFAGSGTTLKILSTAGLTINTGATLTINADTLNISNGGTLTINGTLVNSGTVRDSTTAAKFIVNGTYQHNVNGTNLPLGTWNTNSTIYVTGMTTTNVGNMNQNFYNINWYCPGQTANENMTWRNAAITIGGSINISSTGSGSVGLTDGLSTLPVRYTINGNVNLSAVSGSSVLTTTSSTSITAGVSISTTIKGNLTIGTGSTYSFHSVTAANGHTDSLILMGSLSNQGTITSATNASDVYVLNFNGGTLQTFSNTGTVSATLAATTVNVSSGSTLDMGTSSFPSNIAFVLSGGATLQTAHTGGVNGSIAVASPSLSSTANYIFNGIAAQVTGASLTNAANITISNSAGVSLSGTTAVSSALNLTSGTLTLGGQTLNLANGATISRSAGSLSGTPTFGSTVNVVYAQNGSGITTGTEIPSSSSVLNNLTVSTTNGVALGSSASVNGTLSLASSLTLGSNNLALAVSHAVAGTLGASNHIATNSTGYVTSTAAYSTAYTFPVGFNGSSYNAVRITPAAETPTVRAAAISPALTNSLKAMWVIGGVTSSSTGIDFIWNSTTDAVATAQRSGMVYSLVAGSWGTAIDGTGTTGSSPNYATNISGVAITSPSTFTVGPPSAATLSLASVAGTDAQLANTSTAITTIVYEWAGSATTATVSWTGTANSSTAPTGISVVIDNVNNTVTMSGTATAFGTYGYTVLTDGSPAASKTGSITVSATSSVVLALVTPATAGNIFPGFSNNIITNFSIAASTSSATLTSVSVPITAGAGLVTSDLNNYKLYYTTGTSFNTSTLLATVTTFLASSPITFSSFTQTIASGAKGYFWVTADVSNSAVLGHTLTANALATSNVVFSLNINATGSVLAQGTQIITNPIYYNVSNTDISNVNNWGDDPLGTGVHPINFTGSNATFNLKNGTLNSLGSSITLSGTNSKLVIGDSTNNAALTIGNATLTIGAGTGGTGAVIISPKGMLTIGSAGTCIVSANDSLNVSNAAATLTVNGYLKNYGTVANAAFGAMTVFGTGSTYEHNVNGGTVPYATWGTGSTLLVSGITSTGPSFGGTPTNTYNNITWSCLSQTTLSAGPILNNSHILGNLSITGTGSSGILRFFGMGNNTSNTLTVDGNLTISGSSIVTTNGSTGKGYAICNVGGNFSVGAGSTFKFNNGGGGSSCTINMLGGNFSNAGTLTSATVATDSIAIVFQKAGTQTFTNTATNTTTTGIVTTLGNIVVTVNSGTTLSLPSDNTGIITVTGTPFTNNGTIIGGTIVLAGTTAAQSITGIGTVNNFTVNNSLGATVSSGSNKLNITGVLTLQSGQLATNSNVVFKSNSIASSGILGPVGASGNSGSISGTASVERYIPKGYRSYRDIAPGVYIASNTIYNQWQENGSYANNGYGMFITGGNKDASGNTTSTPNRVNSGSGFDSSLSAAKTAYTYTAGVWATIPNTYISLNPYQGYRLLVRGDRSFNLYTTAIDNTPLGLLMKTDTRLRASGTLITGNVAYTIAGVSNGVYNSSIALNAANDTAFSMVANPYVCPVDWGALTKNNITGFYYYLDPTMGSTGAYVTCSAGLRPYIQAGQAFFIQNVKGTTPNPSITFIESAKAISSTKTAVFGSTSGMELSLWRQVGGVEYRKMDLANVLFNGGYSNGFNVNEDAPKLSNSSDNMFILESSIGRALSIDCRLPATKEDIIGIQLGQVSKANYQLQVDATSYSSNELMPYVYDAYTKTYTALNTGINTVSFVADNTVEASYANRFSIVFKPTVLAVKSITATATLKDGAATVSWNTIGENKVAGYTVEKSTNGTAYTAIGAATAKNTATASYSYVDNAPAATSYYRIKATSTDGSLAYSNVVVLKPYALRLTPYTLYPNPLVGKVLNVKLENVVAGKYTVSIYNSLGQKVHEEAVSHNGGSAVHGLSISSKLAKGAYTVTITSTDSKQQVYQGGIEVQ
ncbi:T9SS type A sorting domain-containing protein [Parasediminibacterium sp. JCM 36343]|uniref:T9SS type A sorting domain-containing protein n=1 Tax=Parasediminibacterium sp. JCM 36343 TaxID=3374279 RepID=UPI0039784639